MDADPLLNQLVAELRTTYGCHTIILYGSRARGDHRDSSDYDVLGIREGGDRVRDARVWHGVYLDVWIYPEHEVLRPDATMLSMHGGKILMQKADLGERVLAAVETLFRAGPTPLPPDEQAARRTWATKMLGRIQIGDIEANYRRVWLLTALLEDYFQLRGAWYLGPKRSFAWLQANDPRAFRAFDAALRADATMVALEHLVETVCSDTTPA